MQITPDQAVFLLHSVLPSIENEHRITTKVLKAIPADRADYKPDPTAMSAFDLAWHIASSEMSFLRAVIEGDFDSTRGEKPAGLRELIENYVTGFHEKIGAIKQMTGEQLAQEIDFRGVFQLPAVAYLNFSTSHVIHHRGQLSVYLRPMGAKVPSMYGESHDDRQARLAATN